ncbi:hypothetical protein MCAMS1_01398 [biofilm metagenome]
MQAILEKPFFRWLLLIAVLFIEIVALTESYDIHAPIREAIATNDISISTWLFDFSTEYWRAALWVMGACFLLLTPDLQEIVNQFTRTSGGFRWPRWLALHFAGFAVFSGVTALIFNTPINPNRLSVPWFISWMFLAGLTLALWFCTLAPINFWSQLINNHRIKLFSGVFLGISAWALFNLFFTYEAPLGQKELWDFFSGITFQTVYYLLGFFYSDLIIQPETLTIGTPTFPVEITHGCSGIEGLALISIFLCIYLYLFSKELRFPQVFWLFPIGMLTIWIANAIRLVLLIALGTSYSPEVAERGFHAQAGWIAFILISLALITLTHKMRFFSAQHTKPQTVSSDKSLAMALLLPLLVQLAAMLVFAAFSSGFDWLYPVRISLVAAVLWHYRSLYRTLSWSWDWQALAIGLIVFMIWMLLEKNNSNGAHLVKGLEELPKAWAAVWLCFRVIGSSLVIPIVEELAFRGYLIRKLIAKDFEQIPIGQFSLLSFIVSSLLFGLLHDRWLAGILAGMAYAAALYRRKQIGDAVAAHITTNALIAFTVLTQEQWGLWT